MGTGELANDDVTWQPLGDRAVRIQFGMDIRPETNDRIRRFCRALEREPLPGVVEWVSGYATVTVYYQPWTHRYAEMYTLLQECLHASGDEPLSPTRLIEIAVRYGGLDGPDLDDVAFFHDLTPAEVVARHTAPTYLVYMLGFAPGFPYLGGLPEGLATPRLDTPRTLVPAGSVGIGGAQTGVYPFATPGGWRIIGRTSLVLYDPLRDPPALLQAGDRVHFVSEASHAVG